MTETEIQDLLNYTIEQSKKDLAKGIDLAHSILVDSQGKREILLGPAVRTTETNGLWMQALKDIVRQRRAQAIVLVALAYRGVYTPEGKKAFQQYQDLGILLGIDNAARLGMCKKVKTLYITLQTPLQDIVYAQDYDVADGKVTFGDVVKMDSNTNPNSQSIGRTANFFEGWEMGSA